MKTNDVSVGDKELPVAGGSRSPSGIHYLSWIFLISELGYHIPWCESHSSLGVHLVFHPQHRPLLASVGWFEGRCVCVCVRSMHLMTVFTKVSELCFVSLVLTGHARPWPSPNLLMTRQILLPTVPYKSIPIWEGHWETQKRRSTIGFAVHQESKFTCSTTFIVMASRRGFELS